MLKKIEYLLTQNWFGDLLVKFLPNDSDIAGKTPEGIVESSARKAFLMSTAAAIPPGPFGLSLIMPEMYMITKLQMDMIYAIAKYYNQESKLNATLLTMIFAHEAGLELGKSAVRRVGPKYVIKALGSQALAPLTKRISSRLVGKVSSKLLTSWIPIITAPIFGAFSKRMTRKIGEKAISVFRAEIEIDYANVPVLSCSFGHHISESDQYCQICGERLK